MGKHGIHHRGTINKPMEKKDGSHMPQIEIIFLTDDAYEISQGITI
jgi:hypothetical protein